MDIHKIIFVNKNIKNNHIILNHKLEKKFSLIEKRNNNNNYRLI